MGRRRANPKLESFKQTSTMKPLLTQFLRLDESAQVGEVGVAQGQPGRCPLTASIGTLPGGDHRNAPSVAAEQLAGSA